LAAVGMPLKPIADYLIGQGVRFTLNVAKFYQDKSFQNWHRF